MNIEEYIVQICILEEKKIVIMQVIEVNKETSELLCFSRKIFTINANFKTSSSYRSLDSIGWGKRRWRETVLKFILPFTISCAE